jgi:triosephosphate isomerase (TIM)
MADIFVNLKRFEVPRHVGGLCPVNDPQEWIADVIQTSIHLGLGKLSGTQLVYLLPEGLVATAQRVLASHSPTESGGMAIGCQGVHWKDIETGQNFGAFTSSLPARAAAALGCTWSIIGHSEERRAKLQVIEAYAPDIHSDTELYTRAQEAVNRLICAEIQCAFKAGLNVLLCVGETAAERGEGSFNDQKPRIQDVLEKQLVANLQIDPEILNSGRMVIGYEPIWAIGPGKVPPDAEYISFVSSAIKQIVMENKRIDPVVIYGGGLKEENAAMIAGISTIGGGLVALTRFTGQIGFDVQDLRRIIDRFLTVERS